MLPFKNTFTEKKITLNYLSQDDFNTIKQIEGESYPGFMTSYQDMEYVDIDDFLDYLEIDNPKNVKIIIGDNKKWYLILVDHPEEGYVEVVDMAGTQLDSSFYGAFAQYKDKEIRGDFRETTSYRIIKALEARGKIKIINKDKYKWGNETMYEISFVFGDKNNISENTILVEGIVDNLGQAAAILRGNDKSQEAKDSAKEKIKELSQELTEPYVDLPKNEGGEHSHLPYLVKWLKDGEDIKKIKTEYQQYMTLPKDHKNKIQMNKMKNFKNFFELVHQYASHKKLEDEGLSTSNKSLKDMIRDNDVKNAMVYEDDKVAVFEGVNKVVTAKLSWGNLKGNNKYGLCIGNITSDHYETYRYDNEQTTYFVYFKDSKDYYTPFIIIDVTLNGNYLWNLIVDQENPGMILNSDEDTTKEEIIKKFPFLEKPFSKDVFKWGFPKDISKEELFKKYPKYFVIYVAQNPELQKNPENITRISKSPGSAYTYALLVPEAIKIPEIIKSIAKNPSYAYDYATYVPEARNNPEIMKDIIKGIAKDPEYSYKYAMKFPEARNNPDIIKGIAQNTHLSYEYTKGVPEARNNPEIIKSIAKDTSYAYYYADDVPEARKIPEIITSIAKNPSYAYNYAKKVPYEEVRKIPEIIKSIAKDPEKSYEYAIRVPEARNNTDIIKGIAKDPGKSYFYAINVKEGRNNSEIIKGITSSPEFSYYYAKGVHEERNNPDIIKSIAHDPTFSYIYASDVLRWKDVPRQIINAIDKTKVPKNVTIIDLPEPQEDSKESTLSEDFKKSLYNIFRGYNQ